MGKSMQGCEWPVDIVAGWHGRAAGRQRRRSRATLGGVGSGQRKLGGAARIWPDLRRVWRSPWSAGGGVTDSGGSARRCTESGAEEALQGAAALGGDGVDFGSARRASVDGASRRRPWTGWRSGKTRTGARRRRRESGQEVGGGARRWQWLGKGAGRDSGSPDLWNGGDGTGVAGEDDADDGIGALPAAVALGSGVPDADRREEEQGVPLASAGRCANGGFLWRGFG